MIQVAYPFELQFLDRSQSSTHLKALGQNPEIYECCLIQTHSSHVVIVESNSYQTQVGDALFCRKPGFRLIVKTADCLPIALWDETTGEYAMVHAGWRGVTNLITLKTLALFQNPHHVKCAIGPHIQFSSFEVTDDVANTILNSLPKAFCVETHLTQVVKKHQDTNKKYINLSKILQYQLLDQGVDQHNIWISPIDTLTDHNYCSFRRNKTEERNINSISLAPTGVV
jgi:hypothetical protein